MRGPEDGGDENKNGGRAGDSNPYIYTPFGGAQQPKDYKTRVYRRKNDRKNEQFLIF